MKQWQKRALALGCALTLAAGSAVASSIVTTRTLEAQYMGIKLMVSGKEVTPTDANGRAVEPFAVDGTVYLPVRAVGEALGKEVAWDGTTNTVTVGHAPLDEDARQLAATLEATHPAFALDEVPAGYEAAKAAFLAAAADPACSLYDFTWAAMAYTASLQDEHTRIDPFGGTPQAVLNVGWVADGERLLLTGADGAVTDVQVTAVGGVPTADLFALIDRYVASENQAGRDVNHAAWGALKAILIKADAAFGEGDTVELTLLEGGRTTRKTAELVLSQGAGEEVPAASTEKLGDVFYVDFNMCVDNEEFQAARAALEQAVQNGTRKVVIDVRGNGGGNSLTCEQLLAAMGMQAPEYGEYVRYSPLAMATYPDTYEKDSGSDLYPPSLAAAKANPDVDLVVLTDEGTFSSATMLAVFVRDGKLGTLIGRPSSNKPNHFGDILYVQLENSGAFCTVSHKQWQRPDTEAKGDELTPDVVTAVGEDALAAALAYLAQK